MLAWGSGVRGQGLVGGGIQGTRRAATTRAIPPEILRSLPLVERCHPIPTADCP